MKRIAAMVVLSLMLLPSMALAQRGGAELKPEQAAQMYEDVEIMRRLLLRGLGTGAVLSQNVSYLQSSGTYMVQPTLDHTWWARGTPVAEGVYLKGQGVLFTVTLPATARDPRPDGTRPEPKPDTDWERTRNQLRGEKVTPPDTTDKKQPSVGERVLTVLAKNGHNFSQLPADESVTVVLVFRSDARNVQSPMLWGQATTWQGSTIDSVVQPPAAGGQAARDQQLLGDLHMKNGRVEEAIVAYTKALSVLGDDLTGPLASLHQHATALEELYDKLVQATAKAGKAEATRKLLDRLEEFKKANRAGSKGGTLPSRLILAAPKRLLDQVGTSKITYEEFKKAATVEYLTFPAGAK